MDPEVTLFRLSQEFPANFPCSALFLSVVAKAQYELCFSHLFQSRSELRFYTQWAGCKTRGRPAGGAPVLWAYDIDEKRTPSAAGLQALWDISNIPQHIS
jgi:hypothetical protein